MTVTLSLAEIIVLYVFSTIPIQGQLELSMYQVCDSSGSVDGVSLTPCSKEPCEFYKGTKTTVMITGSFSGCKDNSTRGRASVQLADRVLNLPGIKAEFCGTDGDCTPNNDAVRSARVTVPILTIYPNITTNVTVTVGCGKNQVQACVKAVFAIYDKPSD